MEKPWLEGKIKSSIHPEMDKWLSAVDKLSKAISELETAKEKFKSKIEIAKKVEIKTKPTDSIEKEEPDKKVDKKIKEKSEKNEKPQQKKTSRKKKKEENS